MTNFKRNGDKEQTHTHTNAFSIDKIVSVAHLYFARSERVKRITSANTQYNVPCAVHRFLTFVDVVSSWPFVFFFHFDHWVLLQRHQIATLNDFQPEKSENSNNLRLHWNGQQLNWVDESQKTSFGHYWKREKKERWNCFWNAWTTLFVLKIKFGRICRNERVGGLYLPYSVYVVEIMFSVEFLDKNVSMTKDSRQILTSLPWILVSFEFSMECVFVLSSDDTTQLIVSLEFSGIFSAFLSSQQ